jgi:hypothetical protein
LDWHRLLELCVFTQTLVSDEDGCYHPADFNDGLLLGLRGPWLRPNSNFCATASRAISPTKPIAGELRFPLPVEFRYDKQSPNSKLSIMLGTQKVEGPIGRPL